MANTTEDKISLLLRNKANIKNAIILNNVPVPEGTPLSSYPDLINMIKELPETTELQDLLMICDLYDNLYNGTYIEHIYTQSEQDEIINLLNNIIEEEVIENE